MLSLERCVSVYKFVNRVISKTLLKMRQILLRSASIQSRSGFQRCAHTYIPIPSLFAPPLPSLPPIYPCFTPAHAKRAGAPLRGHHVPAHNRLEVRRVVQLPVVAQKLLLAVTNGDRSMFFTSKIFPRLVFGSLRGDFLQLKKVNHLMFHLLIVRRSR